MTDRLAETFARLRSEGRAAFIPYIMGGDPDLETSFHLLDQLPGAGADIVELGFPFTDPTADGPTIEAAGRRALDAKTSLRDVLELANSFRERHLSVPLVLMGYANPIHALGYKKFAELAARAGVDGVIVVDLPPEEDGELRQSLSAHSLHLIRLATPTTDQSRLPLVLENASGFVYYVSATGVTGAVSATAQSVTSGVEAIRAAAKLPVAVGFGVRTPEQSAAIAEVADGVVAGSAVVEALQREGPNGALGVVESLADAVRGVQKGLMA